MKAGASESLGNKSVLVVDDDEHTRNLLKDLCETAGYDVRCAGDGIEGLALIHEATPDLVLLDLMMPRKDGFQVLKSLREDARYKELAVIILTAMGDMDGKIRGMELGADDYVTKPFKLIELQTRIHSALLVREYRARLEAAEEELQQLRALDPVTGAGTYSQLKASLDSELARSRRYGRPAAALVFGFDDYQGLRQSLGREACDGYLGRLVQEIKGALRGADRLFRMSADEFVMLLPETDAKGAKVVADRLWQVCMGVTAESATGPTTPKVRIGGAIFPHDRVRTSEDLLREANKSFRALQETGGRFVFEP
ncbi:MAG: response regulator [Myxococcaceae bacterium]|nr:response regulator [Myxococcaceae bacterium]